MGRYLNTPGARVLSVADAVVLIERVHASAARRARESLETLSADVQVPIGTIAVRACPILPPTIEERIDDNRAQTVADAVMYPEALATAAEMRGCSVRWYDRETQLHGLATVLGFISLTGVAGLTLGGGIGYLTRRWGWTADNVVRMDIVTSDAELVRASGDENAELFWGLRGGGGNLVS